MVPRLLELGYSVIVMDNLSSGKLKNLDAVFDHPKFMFQRGDILDKTALNEVFNVCTGVPTSVNQLAATLKMVTGKNLNVKYGPAKLGDIRSSYGDPDLAAKDLRFKAIVDLTKGLQMLLEEFRK